jgi:peptidoglycan glycosyltransferase
LIPQTVIGQGDTQISPLHNALIMATIANGGVMMRPYLIDHIENYEGVNVRSYSPSAYKRLMTAGEAQNLTELLTGVVEYGTGTVLNTSAYSVAGKTGTAEYNSEGESHSWFVGFSNVENPDIVVCVVIEEADVSGVRAVNVAKQIFDAYYQ